MRARNIKPGFFENEDLAEVEPFGRLLFAGLWMLADREGRLEDRPKRIKGTLFPYDNCDVDRLLDDLQRFNFIKRYEVAGKRYIQVTAFSRHQNPHPHEKDSVIPKCNDISVTCNDMSVTCQEMQHTCRADSLNPDIMNPDIIDNAKALSISKKPGKRKKIPARFVSPTLEQVQEYARGRNSPVNCKTFWEYYEAGGWKDKEGKPVKNWKQRFITWESKEAGRGVAPTQKKDPPPRLSADEEAAMQERILAEIEAELNEGADAS
jgi:hypothetical protein